MTDRAKLLLVDDRPENLLALEAILEPLEADLVRAASGEEALRRLLHEEFAAILLDVQMPGMDGFQTAELIKQRERTRHVPILFLTAISKDAEHVFRGYSAGAVDYLMKPFEPLVLRAKVAVFIELWQKTVELRRRDALLAEQELATVERESEMRYRSLADAVPQIVWTADANGVITYRNERWYELTGLPHGTERSPGRTSSTRTMRPRPAKPGTKRAVLERRWTPSIGSASPTARTAGSWAARCRPTTAGSAPRPISRTASSPRSGSRSSPRPAGCSGARSTTSRRSPTSRGLPCRGSPTGARSTSSSTDGSSGSRSSTPTRSSSHSPASWRSRCSRRSRSRRAGPSAVLVTEIDERALASFRFNDDQLEIARTLAPKSYVTVPLTARGEVIGSITLVTAESGRVYGEEDAALAQELARHAAAAIDNARLYAEVERRSRAARALEAVGDGVVLVDRDGVIRLWNTAATTITGVSEAETLGRRIDDVVPRWAEIAPLIPVAGQPGEPVRAETVPVELDGRELWISGSGVGFEEGTVYAFRDLTEERRLEEMKADFVATVSHELRTPLAAIYGSAQTIRRTDIELDPEIHDQLLGVIASESDRLGTIVNDLLVAGRLDADQLPVTVERCDPAEVATTVLEAARTHLPENVALDLDVPDRIPSVIADPGQLRQVLVNLVDNAIKYSPQGGPVLLSITNGDRSIRFAIADQGLGIPASEHRRIFAKFYRLDPDMTRGIGGTGLGLYICRELVRRMDGKIWVESKPGKGSTFFVELPAANDVALAADAAGRVVRDLRGEVDRDHREQDHEDGDDVDDRQLVRPREVVQDPDRQRLVGAGRERGHDHLVEAEREREQAAGEQRRLQLREGDEAKRLPGVGAEVGGCLLQ